MKCDHSNMDSDFCPNCGKQLNIVSRSIHWLPPGENVGATRKKVPLIPFERPPDRYYLLWLVIDPIYDEYHKPTHMLNPNYFLKHHVNSFLEDRIHDWIFFQKDGQTYIKYHGISDGGTWILMEERKRS